MACPRSIARVRGIALAASVSLTPKVATAQTSEFVLPGVVPTIAQGLRPGVTILEDEVHDANGDGSPDHLLRLDHRDGLSTLAVALRVRLGWLLLDVHNLPISGSASAEWSPPVVLHGQTFLVVVGFYAPATGIGRTGWIQLYRIDANGRVLDAGHLDDSRPSARTVVRDPCIWLMGRRQQALCLDATTGALVRR